LLAAVLISPEGETLLLPPAKVRGETADDVPTLVSGMWHFPTASSTKDHAGDLRVLLRGLAAKAKPKAGDCLALTKVRHAVTYRKVIVLPYLVPVAKLPAVAGTKRLLLADVSSQSVSNLTRKIARAALHLKPEPGTGDPVVNR